MPKQRTPVLDRLIAKIEIDYKGCWIFTGTTLLSGYGQIRQDDKTSSLNYTHRVMWEQLVGPIPDGMWIDHLCRVRACCNPDHLEVSTPSVNGKRGALGRHGRCKHGHEMTEANTYACIYPSGHVHTDCRQCKKARNAARKRGTKI